MPLYEYSCRDCENRFEVMRRMSERTDAPKCDACGSDQTALAMSASAFIGVSAGGGGGACSTSTWTGGG